MSGITTNVGRTNITIQTDTTQLTPKNGTSSNSDINIIIQKHSESGGDSTESVTHGNDIQVTLDGRLIHNTGNKVTISFSNVSPTTIQDACSALSCAWTNDSSSNLWRQSGCSTTRNDVLRTVTCECNHLTVFSDTTCAVRCHASVVGRLKLSFVVSLC